MDVFDVRKVRANYHGFLAWCNTLILKQGFFDKLRNHQQMHFGPPSVRIMTCKMRKKPDNRNGCRVLKSAMAERYQSNSMFRVPLGRVTSKPSSSSVILI